MHPDATTRRLLAKIVYAPAWLPDELLYSWLARLAALNAMGAPRDVLMRIFGCRTMVPSVDLPTRVLQMSKRLGDCLSFPTSEVLLEDSTLLPYHRPFLTEASYSRVYETLLHGHGKGVKTLMGRVANRFGAHPALRSCPDCLALSLSSHGGFYWLRRHQLPGVTCCSIHGTPLQYAPLHARTHRQRLILPAAMGVTQRPGRVDARQLRFAQLSQELVVAALPVIPPCQRAAAYRAAAVAQGYGTRRGRVNLPELTGAMRRRFEDFEGFEHQARLLATPANPLGWLRSLFERPQRSMHPICHLLLIEFLFGSVAAFKAAYSLSGPAPNDTPTMRATEASRETGPIDAIPAKSRLLPVDREAVLQDPSLSCRQVAARVGWSVTTVVTWRRAHGIPIKERRKSLHPEVIDKVLNALGSLTAPSAVAAQTGISLSSVYRILAHHLLTPRSCRRRAASAQAPLRRERWTEALQACRNEGLGGVVAARARAAADYAWLYRNDRVWLASTTSGETPGALLAAQIRHEASSRVDWAGRDAELCRALLQQLADLQNEAPSRRLTMTRLLRPLGEAMVRRNMSRLPQLVALLGQVVESAHAFGMRRVDHAISRLLEDGAPLQLWRIQRLAGLRQWLPALTTYANDQIERLNAPNSVRPQALS